MGCRSYVHQGALGDSAEQHGALPPKHRDSWGTGCSCSQGGGKSLHFSLHNHLTQPKTVTMETPLLVTLGPEHWILLLWANQTDLSVLCQLGALSLHHTVLLTSTF